MRVFLIGRNYQASEIDVAEAVWRFIAWLADDANPVLTNLLQRWLSQPADRGGLGALAESARDLTRLRVEVIAVWPRAQQHGGHDGQVQR